MRLVLKQGGYHEKIHLSRDVRTRLWESMFQTLYHVVIVSHFDHFLQSSCLAVYGNFFPDPVVSPSSRPLDGMKLCFIAPRRRIESDENLKVQDWTLQVSSRPVVWPIDDRYHREVGLYMNADFLDSGRLVEGPAGRLAVRSALFSLLADRFGWSFLSKNYQLSES